MTQGIDGHNQIIAETITDVEIHPDNKDGLAGVPSLRTLGTGAQQAAAGNHDHASVYIPLSYLDPDGTLAANSDLKVATQKAVKTYADARIAANDALVYKGAIDASANPNYPAADAGHAYKISVAGKIGGASGINVEVGDLILCILDGSASGNQATVGANWDVIQVNLDGAVIGPTSAVSGNFASFNGTGGKLIQDSGVSPSSFQPINAHLTQMASLTPSDNDFMQYQGAGAWQNRTVAQVLADLLEGIQDIIGAMFFSSDNSIDILYDDSTGSIDLVPNYSTLKTNLELVDDSEGDPAPVGLTAADGTSLYFARRDHVHAITMDVAIRNFLMNGDAEIWQRGTSYPSIANATRIADNFKYQKAGAVVHDVTRDTDVPTFAQSGHKSNYSIKLDVTTVDASIAAGDFCGLTAFIEGYDYAELKDQQITVSFWVKSVKTGIHCVAFKNSVNDRSYVSEYTINAGSTWEKKTITLTVNQSGGTEDYANGLGLSIFWTILSGSTFHTTANAWQTGNFLATSNQVNGGDNTANNFWIDMIKVEIGPVATPFRGKPFREELAHCLTQFYKTFEYAITPATLAGTLYGFRWPAPTAGATTHRPTSLLFPVPMRIAPTITFYNPSAANAQVRDVTGGADCTATAVGAVSQVLVDINCTGAAGTAVGNSMIVCLTAEAGF